MTDRFPLIVDPSTQRVKELASGDKLDLTGSGIVSDVFTVDTNSEERLRIDSSGNIKLTGDSPFLYLSDNDNNWIRGSSGLNQIRFGTVNSERMRIDSSGNIGIGVISPDLKLEVSGGQNQTANQFTDLFRVAANANNDAADAEVQLNFGISPSHTDTANRQARIQAQTGGGTGRDLLINPAGGNVGIDVTVPSSLLSLGNAVSAQKLLVYENPGTNNSKYGFGIQSGEFRSFYPSDGIATFGTISTGDGSTFSEKARLDSSGRLLVGTSSSTDDVRAVFQSNPTDSTLGGAIALSYTSNSPANSDWLSRIDCTDSSANVAARIIAARDGGTWTSGSSHPGRLVFSTTANSASSPTERMRINNQGGLKVSSNGAGFATSLTNGIHEITSNNNGSETLLVTNTNNVSPVGMQIYYSNNFNNTANYFLTCYAANNLRAGFRSNGGLANYSANNVNLSDRNVKKDISPAAGTWDCLKEWEIVNFRYKDQLDDSDLNMGVIAQQVAENCPEVITVFSEAKEATDDQPAQEERLGVKEQQMYWMAIKALQEAQVRIETLEQRLSDAGIA